MEYTIEQKAVALLTNTLWWRFDGSRDGGAWTRMGDDIVRPGLDQVNDTAAEYHIGDEPPKPARVLSELERELLAACVNAGDMLRTYRESFVDCSKLRDTMTDDPIAHGLVLVTEDVWVTPDDAEVVRDYDRAISLLDAAISKAKGEA